MIEKDVFLFLDPKAGEFYIENVLRGKSAENRVKRLPAEQLEMGASESAKTL
jgi:hypothetical protein